MLKKFTVPIAGLLLLLAPLSAMAQDCVEIDLEMTPTVAQGGRATFSSELTNCGPEPALVEIVVSLTLPVPLPIEDPAITFYRYLGAGETEAFSREFPVPPVVPVGVYEICATATVGSASSSDCAAIEITEASNSSSNPTLDQNSPNPFNIGTSITFSLDSPTDVQLAVYNVLGEKVVTLADGLYGVGEHTVEWDGRDARGRVVASGMYFYRIVTPDGSAARKMMLMK